MSYTEENLERARQLVQEDGNIYGAARRCGVPENTLRDRATAKVRWETKKSRPPPLLGVEGEMLLVDHLKQMCSYGNGLV